jgi:DNA-binding transcriptional LysR family regulator
LARHSLVTLPAGTSTRNMLDVAFESAGTHPTIAVETDQREAVVPLVLAGAGAAVVPAPMAEVARLQGAVVAHLRPGVAARPDPPRPMLSPRRAFIRSRDSADVPASSARRGC